MHETWITLLIGIIWQNWKVLCVSIVTKQKSIIQYGVCWDNRISPRACCGEFSGKYINVKYVNQHYIFFVIARSKLSAYFWFFKRFLPSFIVRKKSAQSCSLVAPSKPKSFAISRDFIAQYGGQNEYEHTSHFLSKQVVNHTHANLRITM